MNERWLRSNKLITDTVYPITILPYAPLYTLKLLNINKNNSISTKEDTAICLKILIFSSVRQLRFPNVTVFIFCFIRNCQSFSQSDHTILHSFQQCIRVLATLYPRQHLVSFCILYSKYKYVFNSYV